MTGNRQNGPEPSSPPLASKAPPKPNPAIDPPPEKAQIFAALEELMRALRCPQHGCAWDRKQTMASIVPHTIEEAYEVADAVTNGNLKEIKNELADLLFHVVYYSQLAAEQGEFDLPEVAQTLYHKIIRRHPHVFDNNENLTPEQVVGAWQKIKARERQETDPHAGALDGVAKALPALLYAQKIQERARGVGFEWPDVIGALAKVEEEVAEVREAIAAKDGEAISEEIGDLLFACVNLARFEQIDAEATLTKASRKFEQRFRAMEAKCMAAGTKLTNLDLAAMEELWQEVKKKHDDPG